MLNFDEMKPYVIDTNTLIEDPHLIRKYHVVVTSHVLREIEKLELTHKQDKELIKKIIKAKQTIDEVEDTLFVDLKDYTWNINDSYDKQYVDNMILQCCVENDYGLITRDKLLRIKAKMYNIPVIKPENESSEQYKGYKVIVPTDEEHAYLYSNLSENIYELFVNQYLILRNESGKTLDIRRWDGKSHVELRIPYDVIKPKNDLQACALDTLYNDKIPVKFILGTYGSGKTFLATKIAVDNVVKHGKRNALMVIRNPIGAGEQIGFLSGDFGEKTDRFFKPIVQHLEGGEQEAETLEKHGVLKKEIPFYMKGLSVDETFMVCDEAEDLDVKMIKLVGTRMGTNSVLAFCGDYNQAEGKFINNNGLMYAVEGLKGNPLVGVVVLDLDVRSEASKIFADL